MRRALFALLVGTSALVAAGAVAPLRRQARLRRLRPRRLRPHRLRARPTWRLLFCRHPGTAFRRRRGAGSSAGTQAQAAPAATAPAPPQAAAPAAQAAPARRGPANICKEVVAFLRQPPAPPPAAAAAAPPPAPPPAGTATALAAPGGVQPAGPQPTTSAVRPQGGAAPAVEAANPPPQGQNATPPQTSGQTGPIPQAPQPLRHPGQPARGGSDRPGERHPRLPRRRPEDAAGGRRRRRRASGARGPAARPSRDGTAIGRGARRATTVRRLDVPAPIHDENAQGFSNPSPRPCAGVFRMRSAMANVVVVGAQWGDEGKGKIVDWLSSRPTWSSASRAGTMPATRS